MESSPEKQPSLTRFAWLSIGAALLTMAIKTVAYLLTGSVGLLSNAIESIFNLVGAVVAQTMLTIAARPPDEEHCYGHSKAEYFSSGIEGTLILIAALGIAYTAVQRLITPKPIEQVGLGLVVSAAASVINLVVGLVLQQAGKRSNSITLEANAKHLMTGVWTSVGVIVGVGAVALTGWVWLDPVVAILGTANIIWSGFQIIQKSFLGHMDTGLPPEQQTVISNILEKYRQTGIVIHALRTRQAGTRAFISLHMLVPGDWTIQHGHDLAEAVELDLRQALPNLTVNTHLESLEDPASWQDTGLDRPQSATQQVPPEENKQSE
jgi:cation diffusion facilitator family transporter